MIPIRGSFSSLFARGQCAFFSSIKTFEKLYLFEGDPLPAAEDVWRPKKGLHFPEQFYGLYAGVMPIKTFRITKKSRSKRHFHVMPKVMELDLYSELMDESFRFKVTAKALTEIEKDGGLDNYLLYRKLDDINSYEGIRVRKMLKAKLAKEKAIVQSTSEELQ